MGGNPQLGESLVRRLLVSALSLIVSMSAFGGTKSYKIKDGDSISGIAAKHSTTWNAIRKANHLKSDKLKLGQVLIIPTQEAKPVAKAVVRRSQPVKQFVHAPGTTWIYTVKDGDSDWLIARRFDIHISELKSLNPGVLKLRPGQKIRVPSNTSPLVTKSKSKGSSRNASTRPSGRYAMISANNVRVRRLPSKSGRVKQVVAEGTPVILLDKQIEWSRVRFPYGSEGWVKSDLLAPITKAARKQLTVAIRNKKRAEAEYVASASSSRTHKRKRSKHKYRYVRNRHTGHVTREVDPSWVATNDGQVDTILQTASKMRGVRYKYAAMSRSATDCSGYTKQVFAKNGVSLPRTSGAQSSVGSKVDRSGLKPGDLVFFRTVRGKRVSHVGIYMGNGKFIHASSGGRKVQVNSLSDGYYNRRFVTARRIVKGSGAKKAPKHVDPKPAEKTGDPSPSPSTSTPN